jgi:hypothetical protein
MRLKVWGAVACVVAAFAGVPRDARARGQAIDGIIEGVVGAQQDGASVAGAGVRAFNTGTGYERAVVSDAKRRYGMRLMPPGEYVLMVEAPSYASINQTGVVLRAGSTLTVEFSVAAKPIAIDGPVEAAVRQ